MPRDFDISPYFDIVKPTIERGFDYTTLHWADKQKPLGEVADPIGGFPRAVGSPPLVPETPDAPETVAVETEMTARIVVTGHGLRDEHAARAEHEDIAA